ncbi:MAG: glycosyltransferase family 2 protein, partial [Acidimicrobiia bacterium]|nr:glycosyltransferase family 2 protein [Acidimicrobiia bacterium]
MTQLRANESALKVVVTMPAYHAGRTLEKTLADLPDHLSQHVIVVDDASTDDTVEVARRLGLTVYAHAENKGYGANQKTCYQAALDAGADVVVMLHPDYQYDPKAVPLLIGPILSGHADMTFGSRFAGMSDPRSGGMPWYRYYGNRATTIAQNLVLGTRFSEFHSGLRAYSRKALLSMPFLEYSDDFDFDAQFICDAVTKQIRVVEVPIPTSYTKESSSIAIGASLRYVARSIRHSVAARANAVGRSKLHRTGDPKRLQARGPIDETCPACGEPRQALIYPSTVLEGDEVVADEFTCTSATVAYYDDIVQCTGCGVIRSLPDLDQAEIASVYEETEDDVYLDQEEARRELFSWMLDKMDSYVAGDRRLLEFGSHLGLFLSEAREHGWLT